ncbi:MAG: energy-coupling factor transporter transmembrane protein EcfT [Ruminococcaceae bacterium]|nr:energy-coupling factor transporter transmembrane protein EcfT [Oscillospiraceae bacterium]
MISDITLGQYFPGKSPIHKLDPRTKILLTVLYIVAVFLANSPIAFLFLIISVLSLIFVSRISLRVILKGIKPIVFVLIFTALINVFMTKGASDPLISFWIIKIYKEGIIRAVFMALRVVLLIIGTSVLLTYTTSPISLTDGIEKLLSPLKKIGIPVHVFAMMMTIALRFIPTLIEETEKIMNAQKSRGADFSSGSLVKRAKALIPLLIPLFVSSFKRADELAVAMECRCYRGDKNRTKLVKLTYRGRDFIWFGIGLLFLAAIIYLKITPAHLSAIIPEKVYDVIFYKL